MRSVNSEIRRPKVIRESVCSLKTFEARLHCYLSTLKGTAKTMLGKVEIVDNLDKNSIRLTAVIWLLLSDGKLVTLLQRSKMRFVISDQIYCEHTGISYHDREVHL